MSTLLKKEYTDVSYISGPLLFLENAPDLAYNAIVNIKDGNGRLRGGQVIDVSTDVTIIQVFEEMSGIDLATTTVNLVEDVARLGVVRGQKLPIFSGAGLPANEVAAQIARQVKVVGEDTEFAVVFAAMGVTQREVTYFTQEFERTGALARSVLFLNKADDPAVERLLTPRMALTAAEYLAFEEGYHVLVILTDLTNYCEALREIGGAREEIPGRRRRCRWSSRFCYTDSNLEHA